jgi:hypothetical protein
MKFKKGNQMIEVLPQEYSDGFSPRDFDNLGTMVCSHKQYDLGDQQCNGDLNAYFESKDIDQKEIAIMLPLWLYDHSGITMSCGDRVYPFNDQWDSGLVGFIFITKEKIKKEYDVKRITKKLLDKVTKSLKGEVHVYDLFISGEVYQYTKYELKTCSFGDEHKEIIDSCGGFYGDLHESGLWEELNLKEWVEIEE